MGACCSGDSLPAVPKELIPDPLIDEQITCVTKSMWSGRDYSVHKGSVYPTGRTEYRETMWMWLNKSNDPTIPQKRIVDLENFRRGRIPEDLNKGVILCRATFFETPVFEQFQRIAGTSSISFLGFYPANQVIMNQDAYYLQHPMHASQIGMGFQIIGPDVITKWKFTTQVELWDGEHSSKDSDTGRNTHILHGKSMLVDIFSTGTVATTWRKEHRRVDVRDNEGRVVGERYEEIIHKYETEYVDRIEYRLILHGQLVGQWIIPGNAAYDNRSADVTVQSPFFTVNVVGGWFASNKYVIQTLPMIDPAFALVLAHLSVTEFSIGAIKKDLQPNTGSLPPSNNYAAPSFSTQYSGVPFNGNFSGPLRALVQQAVKTTM